MDAIKDKWNILVNPEGKLVRISPDEIDKALRLGYRHPTPDDISVHNAVQDSKGLAGGAKVFLNQFTNQALMGVPGVAQDYIDTDLEKAKTEAIKKEHNVANIVGGAAGFGSSLLYGGGLAKLGSGAIKKIAGEIVETKLGRAAAESGVNLSKSVIGDTATKIVGNIVKKGGLAAAEGSALMAPQALTEAAFGDYEHAGESLLAGGLVGTAIAGAGGVLKGITEQAAKQMHGGVEKLLGLSGDHEILDVWKKKNSAEIEAAAERLSTKLGTEIKPTKGMITDSYVQQRMESSVAQTASIPGGWIRASYRKIFDPLKKYIDEFLTPEESKSIIEGGDIAQKSLLSTIAKYEEQAGPIYKELEGKYDGHALLPNIKKKAIDEVTREGKLSFYHPIRNNAIEAIESADSIGELSRVKTAFYKQRKPGMSFAEKEYYNKINKIFINARNEAFDSIDTGDRLVNEAIKNSRAQADNIYKTAMQSLKPITDTLKIKPDNLFDIATQIESLEPIKVAQSLFNIQKIKALTKLKNNFPDIFEALKAVKLSEMQAKITDRNGSISPRDFVKSINKIPSEMKALLFGEDALQTIKDVTLLMQNLPERIGPSGTPEGMAFMSLAHMLFQVKDYARYFIYSTDALPKIEEAINNTAKNLDKIDHVLEGKKIFKVPTSATIGQPLTMGIARLIPDLIRGEKEEKHFEKVSDTITSLNQNVATQSGIVKMVDSIANNGAPNIASSMQAQLQEAIRYLYGNLPKSPVPLNMWYKNYWKPTHHQLASFNRKLEVVLNPFSVIKDIQEEKLTVDKVEALKAVYPIIYNQITKRIVKYGVNNDLTKLSYNKKLQLQMLLGTDIGKIEEIKMMQSNYRTGQSQQNILAGQGKPLKMNFGKAPTLQTDIDRINNRRA